MTAPSVVVHGHFYQPPRENPWTEEVGREASAAPFHDWNARIVAECYRPNGAARVFDDSGRVVAIVNNYENLSFDVGPTLLAWLERHEPEVYRRILAADALAGGAMAQAHGHVILPLADERDVRTQVRWGLADFEHRFGRRAEGMWLPETAVNDDVLAVLAEEGVGFTILAPSQAVRARPLGGGDRSWVDVRDGSLDTSRPYRWLHPDRSGRGVDVVFYDGGLSHAVAFELATLSSRAFVDRVTTGRAGLVTVATDGETFGHHHRWGERLVAHALHVEAPRRGVRVTTPGRHLRRANVDHEVQVRESAWSCVHGVGRWREDCGCSTGGEPGWNQRWRAPLREALDLLRDRAAEVFERRGRAVLADPWAARDAYLPVVLGATSRQEFTGRHVVGDPVEAFTLLEAQRHALAMYTSCGWFFNDLAGLETVQVLRYAARAMDLLGELGEDPGEEAFLEVLAKGESNVAEEGDGGDVWRRHVEPARVDADRAVAHLALVELLERRPPSRRVGAFDVHVVDHARAERGTLAICSGLVVLSHARTGRRSEHLYAALGMGGLEVLGSTRRADPARDHVALALLRSAFERGSPVTTLLRLVSDGLGHGRSEFDLRSALPDAAEQIVEGVAKGLAHRVAEAHDRFFSEHQHALDVLVAAGYPLPLELRLPAERALSRRVEAEVLAGQGSLDPASYARAVELARDARAKGLSLDLPAAGAAMGRLLLTAVEQALAAPGPTAVHAALAVLRVSTDLGLDVPRDRAQEMVHDALRGGARPELAELAVALGLAVA